MNMLQRIKKRLGLIDTFVCQICLKEKESSHPSWSCIGFGHGDHGHSVEFPICTRCMFDNRDKKPAYMRIKDEVKKMCDDNKENGMCVSRS